jgi:hypothetical protein
VNVKLHIERLVLDGIDLSPADRPVFQAALETELTRLLAEGGVESGLAGGAAVPAVRAKGFETAGDRDPARLGRQVAGSVYGGIGK